MFNSKIYSAYFPIRGNYTQFDEKERRTLKKWACKFDSEVLFRGCADRSQESMHLLVSYLFSSYDGSYDVGTMLHMIDENCFDDYYLAMLNTIIYRHKYNAFLSIWLFPVLTKRVL